MSRPYIPSHGGGRKRGTATIVLIAAAAVIVIGGVAGAVTLTGGSAKNASLTSSPSSPDGTAPGAASGRARSAGPMTSLAGRANSPTGATSSPGAAATTRPPSSAGSSGGGALTLSATGITGPWPVGQRFPGATVTVSGGQAPYTWYAPDLPGGMTATPEGATLAIDGTPAQLGNFTIEVTVIDSARPENSGTYRLPFEVSEIQAQPQQTLKMDPLSLTDELRDSIADGSNASGGIEPYTWTVTGLPSWVKASTGGFGNASLSLLGVASAAGTHPFTVTLSDSSQPRQTVTGHYTLTVVKPSTEPWGVEPLNNTEGVVGTSYSGAFGLGGQTSGLTVTWVVTSGTLPPGLSLNRSTGKITGTPTERGLFTFSIVVTNVATGATKKGGSNFTVYPPGTQL